MPERIEFREIIESFLVDPDQNNISHGYFPAKSKVRVARLQIQNLKETDIGKKQCDHGAAQRNRGAN